MWKFNEFARENIIVFCTKCETDEGYCVEDTRRYWKNEGETFVIEEHCKCIVCGHWWIMEFHRNRIDVHLSRLEGRIEGIERKLRMLERVPNS